MGVEQVAIVNKVIRKVLSAVTPKQECILSRRVS